ncbi:hypothetical protein T10_11388 [Trichinella papuae]|uniref:Uncharacterized protein n=1 Tax=Trichinella papuae TaxID=268474 RepID=A0A0V1M8L2_9BILA|nr:hypothetical protein T10_11388 [Trichinella papuae]
MSKHCFRPRSVLATDKRLARPLKRITQSFLSSPSSTFRIREYFKFETKLKIFFTPFLENQLITVRSTDCKNLNDSLHNFNAIFIISVVMLIIYGNSQLIVHNYQDEIFHMNGALKQIQLERMINCFHLRKCILKPLWASYLEEAWHSVLILERLFTMKILERKKKRKRSYRCKGGISVEDMKQLFNECCFGQLPIKRQNNSMMCLIVTTVIKTSSAPFSFALSMKNYMFDQS